MCDRKVHAHKRKVTKPLTCNFARTSFRFVCPVFGPAHSEQSLSQAHPRLCHHHLRFHLVCLFEATIIIKAIVFFQHVNFYRKNCVSKGSRTASSLWSHGHTTNLHARSAILSENKGHFIFFAWKEDLVFWVFLRLGHPRPLHFGGTGVPWVSLPGPTSVPSDAQAGWHRGQSANPLCGWL